MSLAFLYKISSSFINSQFEFSNVIYTLFIPNSLLNKEELNEQDILILRERTKSLQLIYTIKQAKNECRALTARDTEVDSNIVKSVKKIKNTTNEVLDVITK